MSTTRSAGSSDGRCRFPTSAARAFSPVQFRAHRIHRRNLTDSVGVGRSASAQSGSPSNRSRQATVAADRQLPLLSRKDWLSGGDVGGFRQSGVGKFFVGGQSQSDQSSEGIRFELYPVDGDMDRHPIDVVPRQAQHMTGRSVGESLVMASITCWSSGCRRGPSAALRRQS